MRKAYTNFLSMLAVLVTFCSATDASAQTRLTIPDGAAIIDVDIYGTVYLLDPARATLSVLDSGGARVRQFGGPGWQNSQFDSPSGLWARNGLDIIVADYGNHRVQRFDRTLAFVSSLSTRESEIAVERFGYPTDVAMSRLGDLFMCDGENVRVVKFTGSTRFERSFGGIGGGKGRLSEPRQVELGAADNVYVLDARRVVLFDNFGNFLGELGPGLLRNPSVIFADDEGGIVVDGDSTFFFTADNRLAGVVATSRFTSLRSDPILSLAAAGRKIYALVRGEIHVTDDPRFTGELLDKRSKSP